MKLVTGMKLGELILRRPVRLGKRVSPAIRKQWDCECSCGTKLRVPEMYLTRPGNPKTHCGCKNKTIKTIYNQEYRIWLMMHMRTEDPKHVSYEHYGKRGIKVCAEWHKENPDKRGFERFLACVGPRPSPTHTIDRVDVNLGYQPYKADGVTPQVRWATPVEQRANQRQRSDSIQHLKVGNKDAKSGS